MNRSIAAVPRYPPCRKNIFRQQFMVKLLPIWLVSLVCLLLFSAPTVRAADWLTFGHDPQRTGWASEEHSISPETVGNLTLLWKTKIDSAAQGLWSLTSPVVAENVSTKAREQDGRLCSRDLGHAVCSCRGHGRGALALHGKQFRGVSQPCLHLSGRLSLPQRHYRYAGDR